MSSSSIYRVLDRSTSTTTTSTMFRPHRAALLAALRTVPDPRQPQGLRHELDGILTLVGCAVAAGSRSFVAIAEWAQRPLPTHWTSWEYRETCLRIHDPAHPATPRRRRARRHPGCLCRAAPRHRPPTNAGHRPGRQDPPRRPRPRRPGTAPAGRLDPRHHNRAGTARRRRQGQRDPMLSKLLDTIDIIGVLITAGSGWRRPPDAELSLQPLCSEQRVAGDRNDRDGPSSRGTAAVELLVDRAIADTRNRVYPLHGLDAYDSRDSAQSSLGSLRPSEDGRAKPRRPTAAR